jgi:hypothetical protein
LVALALPKLSVLNLGQPRQSVNLGINQNQLP